MAKVEVRGASDDIVIVEGSGFLDEFYPGENGIYLAFSEGTVLRASYTDDGVWSVSRIAEGAASCSHSPNKGSDSDQYTDIVTLDGDLAWVVAGDGFQRTSTKGRKP